MTNHIDLDHALERLGFSYLDGIPFSVDPRLQEANVDLSRAEALLARQPPSVTGLHSIDLSELGRLETQFLKHLEQIAAENLAKLEAEEKEIKEYLEKKEKEEEVKSAEMKKKEEEIEKLGEETQPEEAAAAVVVKDDGPNILAPNSLNVETNDSSKKTVIAAVQTNFSVRLPPPTNFNYSDFEAESDPFERAELQTLDDLGILASVLQTTSQGIQGSTVAPSFVTSATSQTSTTQSAVQHQQMQTQMQQQGNFFPSQISYYSGNQGYSGIQGYPPVPYAQIPTSQWGMNPPPVSQSSVQPALKSSKSYGDILSEIKREESNSTALQRSQAPGNRDANRKLSSQTPPPRPVPFKGVQGGASSMLDNWIPWPDLDGSDTLKRRNNNQKPSNVDSAKLLDGLSETSGAICKMIHQMGFPLSRVTKVCRALGDDQQQIINYCLLVDKFVESDKFSVEAVEQALLLHSVNEEKSEKHLQLFQRLSELGFEASQIHNTLIHCEMDYERTLETLLN